VRLLEKVKRARKAIVAAAVQLVAIVVVVRPDLADETSTLLTALAAVLGAVVSAVAVYATVNEQ